MRQYFEFCDELKFDDHAWKSYFFAEVSALAYHDGTRARKQLRKIGFRNYKFLDNEGAQCHIFHDSENLLKENLKQRVRYIWVLRWNSENFGVIYLVF